MRSLKPSLFQTSIAVITCILSTVLATAQTSTTGQIIGQVKDPTAAVVPQAQVELRDAATGAIRNTRTDMTGQYAFPQVTPGSYSLTVNASGFAKAVIQPVTVEVGKTSTIDIALQVGATGQIVEVRSTPGAELQTLDATVGNTVGGNELLSLPTLERNTTSLLLLQPLATPQNFSQQSSRFGGQVAGARSDQNSFMLDGGEITNPVSGNSDYYKNFNGGPEGAIPTPVESIQEFNVETNNPSGSQSLSLGGGAQVVMVTKRGGEHYHGSLYYNYNGAVLNANRWDANRIGRPRPNVVNNRFGASFGGHLFPGDSKTYFYANYEGRRRDEAIFVSRLVPTANLRQGFLYGISLQPGNIDQKCGPSGTASCDPRNLGMNPLISQLWALEPPGNDPSQGDGINTIGFSGFGKIPHNDNFGLIRVDHDFGSRFHWTGSYRHYTEEAGLLRQADIGGVIAGDTRGVPKILSVIPRQPRYLVTGLTANLTNNFTNDVHFSFLRDFWQWNSLPPFPIVSGSPAALVPGGDTVNALVPVNIDTQGARTRRWNSHGSALRDDATWQLGNHLLRLGASFNHTWADFIRDDGQQNSQKTLQYFMGNTIGGITFPASIRPPNLPASQVSNYNNLYAQLLGIVDAATILRARDANLNLLPQGTDLGNTVTYKQATLYLQDSWRLRPTLTATYGLAWATSIPSLPADNGKLMMTVNASDGNILQPRAFLAQREQTAMNGQIYNPVVGFTPFSKTGRNYPWPWVAHNFEPRVALAWQPRFTSGLLSTLFGNGNTVIRGGFWHFYDRLNGVQAVIDTLQSVGIGQPLLCLGPGVNAGSVADCRGNGGTDPSTAFRVGSNGSTIVLPSIAQTLTPPIVPGNSRVPNATIALVPNSFQQDPQWTPGSHNQWDLTIQRELPGGSRIEVGYVGHTARNIYQGIDLNQVPFFFTAGGQTFAQAFDAVAAALRNGATSATIAPQPFFEAALAGSTSFCAPAFASCTAGVVSKQGSNISTQRVRDVFQGIQSAFALGPVTAAATQVSGTFLYWSSLARSNYNAGFASYRIRAAKGLTLDANVTYAHSLDNTGVNQDSDNAFSNSFDPHYDYGTSLFDRKFVMTVLGSYELPFHASGAVLEHVIGGWRVSPIVTLASGLPLRVLDGSGQEFGTTSSGASSEAIRISSGDTSAGRNRVTPPSGSCGSSAGGSGSGLNIFSNPVAVCAMFRPVQPSVDKTSRGGTLRGFKPWDAALSVAKKTTVTEQTSFTFTAEFFNLFNHVNFADPAVSLQSPQTFGVITTQGNDPRAIQLGLRLDF